MADIDLYAPFERDTILEVRTGKMKPLPNTTVVSGIDKQLVPGKIWVTPVGLEADEHDLTVHGGREKAIHGYCSAHYTDWRREYPEAEARFKPGAFGENFVTVHMNERNVCVGDIMAVGTAGLLLQVSLPRQPCSKLNHRFDMRNFAPLTYKKSRTGWYYRVLKEGYVQAGDEIRLVERKWPQWTIEQIQEYLHRSPTHAEMNEQLSKIGELGEESRKVFETRVAKLRARQKRNKDRGTKWRDFKIVEKRGQTARITSFVLEAVTPVDDALSRAEKLGANVKIRLPNGLIRSYSIVSGNDNRFELGVARAEASRGGSAYLHDETKVGDVIQVGRSSADINLMVSATHQVFIIGGIGITAFLSLMEKWRAWMFNVEVHYAIRSAEDMPFRERIQGLGDSVNVYDGSKGQRMDIPGIFRNLKGNSHVYVCGPIRMLEMAAAEAKKKGLGEDEVHYEAFSADITGDPFEVEVGNQVLKVEGDETLLEVLRREFDVPSSCEVGNCGTCKLRLKSGRVEHRGSALTDEEKKTALLSCVSRGIGRIAIEI
ncbi:PK beta-barrel-protein domain-containing protein-like protein [Xylaria sp. CBS 124048]|nr:PK beta-barrel-protein domain-containing protein-like protein [Xylaria sp. CBS 124048]